MMEDLATLTPDPSRSAATMARCHVRLAARRRRGAARDRTRQPRVVITERLLAVSFCVAYLLSMAGEIVTIAAAR